MILIGVLLKAKGNAAYWPTEYKMNFDFKSNPKVGKKEMSRFDETYVPVREDWRRP